MSGVLTSSHTPSHNMLTTFNTYNPPTHNTLTTISLSHSYAPPMPPPHWQQAVEVAVAVWPVPLRPIPPPPPPESRPSSPSPPTPVGDPAVIYYALVEYKLSPFLHSLNPQSGIVHHSLRDDRCGWLGTAHVCSPREHHPRPQPLHVVVLRGTQPLRDCDHPQPADENQGEGRDTTRQS